MATMQSGVRIGDGGEQSEHVTANSEDGREYKNSSRPEVTEKESVVNKDNAPQPNLDEPRPSLRNWLSGWKSKVLRMITTHLKSSPRQEEAIMSPRSMSQELDLDFVLMGSMLPDRAPGCSYSECSSRFRSDDTPLNYGRWPLNSDLFAPDSVRPLPSSNEDTYGGGRYARRESEARIQTGNVGQVNGTSGTKGLLLIHPPDQVPPQCYARKTKNLQSGLNTVEPQMNGAVDPGPAVVSRDGQERPSLVAQAPAHPETNLQAQTSTPRANQAISFPPFGAWNTDPSQAESNTIAFARPKEERRTPLNNNVAPSYHNAPRNYERASWIRDLFVDCCRHRPSVQEDAYGGGSRTKYDQVGSEAKIQLGNAIQVNVASTPQNLMPTMSTIHQLEQKPTKQKGRRCYWLRRRNDERNVVP